MADTLRVGSAIRRSPKPLLLAGSPACTIRDTVHALPYPTDYRVLRDAHFEYIHVVLLTDIAIIISNRREILLN